MTRNIPDSFPEFVRCDEHAIALGNSRRTDDQVWQPTICPFDLPYRTQKREHSRSRCAQFLPVGVRRPIRLANIHDGLLKRNRAIFFRFFYHDFSLRAFRRVAACNCLHIMSPARSCHIHGPRILQPRREYQACLSSVNK